MEMVVISHTSEGIKGHLLGWPPNDPQRKLHRLVKQCCALAIVYKGKGAISVELLLLSDTVVYSFLGGTDEAYFYARANDLLKLEVMNWARKLGYEYYFLGGGKVELDNLYNFKKRFFPKDEDLTFYTGRKILNPAIYNKLVDHNPDASKSDPSAFFPLYRYKQYE